MAHKEPSSRFIIPNLPFTAFPFTINAMQQTRTRRQKEVLDFVTQYIDRNGYEPSYQLIARHLGVRAKSGIVKHIEALEEMGFLKRRRDEGGFMLEVIRTERAAEPGLRIEWLYSAAEQREREDWEKEPIAVPAFMLGGIDPEQVLAFRVPDDAMSGREICEGDVALIERRDYFRDGNCVAVTVSGNETVLRKSYRVGADIELRGANNGFEIIRVEADRAQIHGVYRGLLRPLA